MLNPLKAEPLFHSKQEGWFHIWLLGKPSVARPKVLLYPPSIWKPILCSLLSDRTSNPEATKNGLSLREACVTPVWPHRLLSTPSLLQRSHDLRQWGGKLIRISWRRPVFFIRMCARSCACSSWAYSWKTTPSPSLHCLLFSVTYKHNGQQWSILESRLPFHQCP